MLAIPAAWRVGDPLEGARGRLRATDKWTRAEAVEELARIGSEEAWELVIGALADPKGEVADTAQLVLAAVDAPETLERLAGAGGLRSKDAGVRARAAEVWGRLARAPRDEDLERRLARALGDEDAEVRRMAAWSFERRASLEAGESGGGGKEAVEALERRARSDRDPLVRVRALGALVAVDPATARRPVTEACGAREPLLRGAGAAWVGRVLDPGEALARLGALAADQESSVRRVAVEALAELGTRGAFERLVARLETEPEERLLGRLVEHLRSVSGLKHKRDPRPWNDWLRGLPTDWKGMARRPEPEDPATATSAALAGLPILSKRVTILIDLSGSIWNVRPDGRTRKQAVDAKLRETLEALPSDTRFNLIPYTSAPIPWKPRLVPASPARVREAAAWFEARHENGSGNFWDAALLALEDPEVDTLVVLFDGAPTGGTRHRLELIVPLFLERNQARRVAVDLILVDASRKLQRLWGGLADGTGGRLLSVSL